MIQQRRFLLLAAALTVTLGLAGLPATVSADVLYGITFNDQLISIDPTTGAGTLVGNLDSSMAAYGLAVSGGNLYTYDQTADLIRQIDPATGHTLASINIGAGNLTGEGDLAFRSDGTGVLSTAAPGPELISFSISPGSSSVIGTFNVVQDGLAFDKNDNLLSLSQGASDAGGSHLYSVNQTTAATTAIGGPIAGTATMILGGLSFRSDGTLYGELSDNSTVSNLYTIDPTTGAATLIGPIGFAKVSGIAFLGSTPPPPLTTPEPSSVVLLGLGLAGCAGLVRRRRAACGQ